jgi:hypothetical protein
MGDAVFAQYLEIRAEIETRTYPLLIEGSKETARRSFSVLCIVGADVWQIENDFPANSEHAWFYDGTNVIQRSKRIRPASDDVTEKLRKGFGLAPVPFTVAESNVTIRIVPSPMGHPLGDPGVNIPWLAFCSGPYLRREGRLIPLPVSHLRRPGGEFAYSDRTETFNDGFGLPRKVELFTSRAHNEVGFSQTVLQNYYGIEEKRPGPAVNFADLIFGFQEGALKFRYVVLDSTNFLGWNIPLEFEYSQKERLLDGALVPRYSGAGRVTSITEGTRPHGVFTSQWRQNIVDYRFRQRDMGVDAIVYGSTNDYVLPANDPTLEAIFAARLERAASRGGDPSGGWVRATVCLLLVLCPIAFVLYLKRRRRSVCLLAFGLALAVATPAASCKQVVRPFVAHGVASREAFWHNRADAVMSEQATFSFYHSNGWWRIDLNSEEPERGRPVFKSCMRIPDGVRVYMLFEGGGAGMPSSEACPITFPPPGQTLLFALWLGLCPEPELPIIGNNRMRRFVDVPNCRLSLLNHPKNEGTYFLQYIEAGSPFRSRFALTNNGVFLGIGNDLEDQVWRQGSPFQNGFLELEYETLESRHFDGVAFPAQTVLSYYRPLPNAVTLDDVYVWMMTKFAVTNITSLSVENMTFPETPERLFATDHRVPGLADDRGVGHVVQGDVWPHATDAELLRRARGMDGFEERSGRAGRRVLVVLSVLLLGLPAYYAIAGARARARARAGGQPRKSP